MSELISAGLPDKTDAVEDTRSFPFFVPGMIAGALLAGLGLFLIASPTSGAVTRIVGFILFLIGVIVFAL